MSRRALICGVLLCLYAFSPASATEGEAVSGAVEAGAAAVPAESAVAPDAEAPPAVAPTRKTPTREEVLVREGEALNARIELLAIRIRELSIGVETAVGEDKLIIERELMRAKLDVLEIVGSLVDNYDRQLEAGLDPSEQRKIIVELLADIGPAIQENAQRAYANLGEMRGRREVLEGAELFELDQAIVKETEWLDTLFAAGAEHIARMDAMELDSRSWLKTVSDSLRARSQESAQRLRLVIDQIAALEERAGDPPTEPEDQVMLSALQARKQATIESLRKIVRIMSSLGHETARYEQLLITSTGAVTADIFKPEVAAGLIQQGVDHVRTWLRSNAVTLIFRVAVFVLIVVVFRVIAVLVRRLLYRAVSASQVKASKLLQNMLISMLGNAITLLGVLVALSQLGIQMGPLLAGLGIAGFIVGFALQDSLANFAAGMMIIGYRPYDVGDMVEAGGVFGQVSDMSLVSTTILTIDNQTLVVPNGKIWGDVIKNVSNQRVRRVDMKFRVAYSDDLEHAEGVLRSILDDHPKVLADPAPAVRVHELKESAIEMIVRPWVETPDYWEVYWDVTREVRVRFQREGLTIPFAQQVVHVAARESGPARDP